MKVQIAIALIDLLKALAWPSALLIIAWWFKSDIRQLFPRLRRAGMSGVELDAAAQQKAFTKQPGEQLKQLPGLQRTPTIEKLETQLHANFGMIKDEDRLDLLVNQLAQARLMFSFEKTYNTIFGSQLLGLRQLGQMNQTSTADARAAFEQAKSRWPELYDSYGFEGWFGYPLREGLIEQRDDTVRITDLGRDFLLYVDAQHPNQTRPF